MTTYTASTGQTFTDEDLLRWADDAENGFPGSTVESTQPRAWELETDPMVPVTIRIPAGMLAQIRKRNTNTSTFVRAAIAQELHRSSV
ncbi:MAG: hypothetical protein ACRCWS_06275 [Propionibacteriaceae bacterium]